MIKTYSSGQFAKTIGKSVKTVQRWDESGKLPAHRTPNNHRYYLQSDLDNYFGLPTDIKSKIYLYGRVSSHGQKDDLAHQVEYLQQYAAVSGYQIEALLTDIGSGMNYKGP